MRLRYRFVVALAAALLSAGWSVGSTAHASTMGSSYVASTAAPQFCRSGCGGSGYRDRGRSDRRQDFRQDRREDRFRDHCCDNNNHCCDNNNHGNSGSDCDWLRDHDHDSWLRECQH